MFSNIYLIPLYLSFQIVLGPFLLYVMASGGDHLVHSIPFISDTGNNPPEASIFTILFSFGALLVAITVFIRHKIFDIRHQNGNKCCYSSPATNRLKLLNQCSYICGLLTVLGLTVIGNFRSSEMNSTHNFGTYITCIFGTFDIILQSQIAFNTNSKRTGILRMIIVLLIIPSFFGYIFIEFINKKFWNNVYVRDSLGQSVAAICEWIGFCMFGPFYATFIPEFRQLKTIDIVLNYSDTDRNVLIPDESEFQSVDHCVKPLTN